MERGLDMTSTDNKTRLNSFENYSVVELLTTHNTVLDELRRRQIIRSANNPTGDYTEWLTAQKLGLRLSKNSAKGYDATDDQTGLRYQIKGRRLSSTNKSTQLGVIRNLERCEFDFVIAVVFNVDWQVKCAAKIPHAVVAGSAKHRAHVNGHVLHVRPSLFEIPGVEDVTGMLRT